MNRLQDGWYDTWIVTHLLAHCHRKVKHRQPKKCVHILCKLYSTGPHSAIGSCSLRVTSVSPLSDAVVTSDVTQPPQWVQQVAVCWIQQVASCSAVLHSETGCTAPSRAGPLPTAGPGRLAPAGVTGQHRSRTRDLVSTRLTAGGQGFEVRHPRCVSNKSNYKVYACIVKHNYI